MADWAERFSKWVPPDRFVSYLSVDMHVAGEPLRVVLRGFPELEGSSMLELRRQAMDRHDASRATLMLEPRGHDDMYGAIVVPPVARNADVGVLFLHNDGFSTMCGHGIIGVATALVELGLVQAREPETLVAIDTPAALVRAHVEVVAGGVERVTFVNVPSFVAGLDLEIELPDHGRVGYDLAYGGAFYAYVDAKDFGLELVPGESRRLIDLGTTIKEAVQDSAPPTHPDADDLGFMYGTVFLGPSHDAAAHHRSVCVFADGQVDRSPTGTGVSGLLALRHARGDLPAGEAIAVESILGTTFSGRVASSWQVGDEPAVIPEVTGRAYMTGRNEIFVDPKDPLRGGFALR